MIVPSPDNPVFKVMRGLLYVWLFALVLTLFPYTEDPATPIKLLLSAAAAFLVAAVWGAGLAARRVPVRPVGRSVYLLLFFLAVQCAAALLSDAPARSLHTVLPWAIFVTLAFLAHQVFSHPHHLRNLFRAAVAAVALSSVYGLAQHFGLDPFPWAFRAAEEYRGLPATYGNPNFAGHALVIALVLCAGLVVDGWRRRGKSVEVALCIAAGALLLTHLNLSHMRGGPVALGGTALAVALAPVLCRPAGSARRAWAASLTAVTLLIAGAAVAGLFFAPHLPLDNSLQLRLHSYAGASALFLDNWAKGVGPGNFALQNIPYWSDFEALSYALKGKRNHHVHNEWLEIATGSGVVGLFLLLLLVLHALFAPFQGTGHRAVLRYTLAAAVLAAAVDACFGFNLHVPVSGALIILLLTLQPDGTERSTLPGPNFRWGAALLVPLAACFAVLSWRHFQGERHYQGGQGALAWAAGQAAEPAPDRDTLEEAALTHFLEAHRYQPWDFRPLMALGDLALSNGQGGEAIPFLEAAHARHPHLPRLQLALARAYGDAARRAGVADQAALLDTAESLALGVTARCPALGEAHAVLGAIYELRAAVSEGPADPVLADKAIAAFESARRNGVTGNPAVEYGLAKASMAAGQSTEAMASLIRAIEAAPNTGTFWDTLETLSSEGDGAIRRGYRQLLLHHVATNTPLDRELRDTLALRLSALPGTPVEGSVAARALRRAIENEPGSVIRWSAWLRAVPEAQRRDALAQRVAEGHGAHPAVLAVARALASPEATTAAFTTLADAMAQYPGQLTPEVNGERYGPLVALLGQGAAAEEALQRGRVAFYLGAFEGAQALLDAAGGALPEDRRGVVAYYQSRVLARRAQPAAALSRAREALQGDRDSLNYQWNFALRLAAVGEVAAARFQLEALLHQAAGDPAARAGIAAALEALADTGDRP